MDDGHPTGTAEGTTAPGAEGDLYVVATVHLDTQWRWTIQRTISEYLPATLDGNFALFEKYPHYVLSWEGAFRYMLIREYYPEAWERLKGYVAEGRWCIAGNMLESVDVNLVSPESLIRHFLYGSRFFERELDATACDVFLPDCFGFSYSLPSIAAHCGLTGFSSQKFIKWIAPASTPFDIGVWEGPDGASVLAALNPEGYGDGIDRDLSRAPHWRERIARFGEATGVRAGYKYFGIGDRGGAPDEASLEWLAKGLEDPGPLRIVHGKSDRFFHDLADRKDRLPRHKGELLLPEHGPGCYTAMASMKRWNRHNELLADAAERAASAAAWTGALPYPKAELDEGWLRFLWHQMHDDLTGTSIPQAYDFSWNDQAIARNRFDAILGDSVGALTDRLDTTSEGVPLVVFNPLTIEREDLVEATVRFDGGSPAAVAVFDPEGSEVPSQSAPTVGGGLRVTFLARVSPVGCAVYDVRPATAACALRTGLEARQNLLENRRYRVEIDDAGDVARVYDRLLERDLLDSPLRLELLSDWSSKFPAWEIRYRDLMAEPRTVCRLRGCRVVESGPARATVEVRRVARGSTYVQRISLAAGGAADRLEIANRVEWKTWGRMVKAAFPIRGADPVATYDLGLGVIERGTNRPESHEVPAQQWADLSFAGGEHGVSVLNDCKYGWDRPEPNRLRLTLIRSPWAARGHGHQSRQDWAWHRFAYALYGHPGDWRQGTVWQAARFNQPLRAFQVGDARRAAAARSFSFARTSTDRVAIRALKEAEDGDELIVRLQELAGEGESDVAIDFAQPIVAAREVNGVEADRGSAELRDGSLVTELGPFQPRSFAVRLAGPPPGARRPICQPLRLPFEIQATSSDGSRGADFDDRGNSLPTELFPEALTSGGIEFELGPADGPNCLACRGQQIPLPKGEWESVFLLAASAGKATEGEFTVAGDGVRMRIAGYRGPIGYPSHRRALGRVHYGPIRRPFLERDRIAWTATHLHDRRGGNLPYLFGHLFRYQLRLPEVDETAFPLLQLPDASRIRIFAATVARRLGSCAVAVARPFD